MPSGHDRRRLPASSKQPRGDWQPSRRAVRPGPARAARSPDQVGGLPPARAPCEPHCRPTGRLAAPARRASCSALWHGFIFPVAWVLSLFMPDVAVYAVPNNGGWYDFGYFIGVVFLGVGSHASAQTVVVAEPPMIRAPRHDGRRRGDRSAWRLSRACPARSEAAVTAAASPARCCARTCCGAVSPGCRMGSGVASCHRSRIALAHGW